MNTLRVSGEISTAMVCFAPRIADVIAVSPTPHPTSNSTLSAIRWRSLHSFNAIAYMQNVHGNYINQGYRNEREVGGLMIMMSSKKDKGDHLPIHLATIFHHK